MLTREQKLKKNNVDLQSQKKLQNSLCSYQDKLQATEYRKDRRLNGLQLPLHPLQIIGWIALALFGLSSFIVIIPSFNLDLQPLLYCILSVLYVVHILSHLAALLIDPADDELRKLNNRKHVMPEFDRTKHSHVIENGRCHLCNIKTSSNRTKHCSVCNKCVGKFDHHCKWLNHCIGGRNYVAFLMCVVSAVVAALVILAAVILEIIFYHIQPEWLNIWKFVDNNKNFSETVLSIPNRTLEIINKTDEGDSITNTSGIYVPIFLAFVAVLGILAAITAGLLLHLCFFHIYISFLGLTTYEYIRNNRLNIPKTEITSISSNSGLPDLNILISKYPSASSSISRSIIDYPSSSNASKFVDKKRKNDIFVCSTVQPSKLLLNGIHNRPQTLHCCDKIDNINNGYENDTVIINNPFENQVKHESTKSFYICSMIEEKTLTNASIVPSKTFHCCSKMHHNHHTQHVQRPSLSTDDHANPPVVEYTRYCNICTLKMNKLNIKNDMNDIEHDQSIKHITMHDKRCCVKTIIKHHRWRRKWNCCSNIPESPDVPTNPIHILDSIISLPQNSHVVEENILENTFHIDKPDAEHNLPKYISASSSNENTRKLSRSNNTSTNINNNNHNEEIKINEESTLSNNLNCNPKLSASDNIIKTGKRSRTRLVRPWPVVRLRHMFRIIGRYRRPRCRHGMSSVSVKQNQIRPLTIVEQNQNENVLPTSVIRDDATVVRTIIPALPQPSRKKKNTPTNYYELANALSFVQHHQSANNAVISPTTLSLSARRARRKNVIRNRSPALSPIHESGLSNPTSPQPCRHSCSASFTTLNNSTVCNNNQ